MYSPLVGLSELEEPADEHDELDDEPPDVEVDEHEDDEVPDEDSLINGFACNNLLARQFPGIDRIRVTGVFTSKWTSIQSSKPVGAQMDVAAVVSPTVARPVCSPGNAMS